MLDGTIQLPNGNTEGSRPVVDFRSNPICALGGVRYAWTEAVVEMDSPNLNMRWSPTKFPGQMVSLGIQPMLEEGELAGFSRTSSFARHFPRTTSVPKLPEVFTSDLVTYVAFRLRKETRYRHLQPCCWDRYWEPRVPSMRPLLPAFGHLSHILSGSPQQSPCVKAKLSMPANRILGPTSDHQVVVWETDLWMRHFRLSHFAAQSSREVSWAEAAFRLWSRYHAVMWATLPRSSGKLRASRRGTTVPLTFINARRFQLLEASNPEGPMWTDDALQGLVDGRKMFVDAEGLSEAELIELLSCLLPTTADDQLFIDYRDPGSSNSSSTSQRSSFLTNPCRYYFPNRIDEVFIHYGSQEVPDSNSQRHIQNNVFQEPTDATVASVVRYLATRHNAGKDLELGLEAVLYRSAFYASHTVLGARKNVGAYKYIAADGSWELHLPRLNTAAAYFDTLRIPVALSEHLQSSLALSKEEFLHSGALVCHARAVSMNWAAYAVSILGAQWAAACPPRSVENCFIRNHIDIWIRRYYTDPVNRWSRVHANAMAFQYGFCPMEETRATEAQSTLDWWTDFQAPYFANPYHELWLMEQIPSHQLLPYYDPNIPCYITCEDGHPQPLPDTQSSQVILDRDVPLSSRTWLANGGITRNAQFYVAQGDGANYRCKNGKSTTQLARWFSQHRFQPPQKPTAQSITWMGPAGTPFSDFILPGSIPALNIASNRTYSWAVISERDNSPELNFRWYYISLQRPNESLMVNYIHPFKL